MRSSLVSLVLLVVVGLVAVGFYRGWFTLSGQKPDAESKKVNVNLTVDRDKIEQDAAAVKQKSAEFMNRPAEQPASATDKSTIDR